MTSDERGFLHAICECPEDDTARLVFADWLSENGDPDRAEFIRVQVELARTPPTTEADERRRKVLIGRHDALWKAHAAGWLTPFSPFAKRESFERGFVQSLEVPATTFLQHAERWFALTPLTHVKITASSVWDAASASRTWWIEPLFASPWMRRLESLDLEWQRIIAPALAALAEHDDLPRLRRLLLARNDLRSEGAAALARMPQLRHLEELDLRSNGITDAGARAIAESRQLLRLTELHMTRNPIRERSWRMLEDRFGDALRA
jgi:uncharacterized protein (TIGR02996 family)